MFETRRCATLLTMRRREVGARCIDDLYRRHQHCILTISIRTRGMTAMRLARIATIASLVLAAHIAPAAAQEWPARPVTLVVPYAAGGPVDTVARIVAARLSEILGQQIIVENVRSEERRVGKEGRAGW